MKILIVSYTGFGDSIVTLRLAEYLSQDKNLEIDVLTLRRCVPIFSNSSYINNIVLYDDSGSGRSQYKIIRYTKAFFKTLSLRKNRYDIVFNSSGYFKFNIVSFFMGGKKSITICVSNDHPISESFQGFKFLIDECINIPDNIVNIYDVLKYSAEAMLKKELTLPPSIRTNLGNRVAIHPLASAECRFWPFENWIELIENVYENDKILVFCAPNEKLKIEGLFGKVLDKVEIVAGNVDLFLNRLEDVRLFIGLDSFSMHAAYYKNVPQRIVLIGASNSKLFAPPNTKVVEAACECRYRPCSSIPKCVGTTFEYSCMKAITIKDVLDKCNLSEISNNER